MLRAALLVVLVLAAGCVAPATTPAPEAAATGPDALLWAERALPFGGGHDHFDVAHHAGLSTPNFQLVGWDPLATDRFAGAGAGAYFCGDARADADGRRLAVVHSFYSDVAFVIADVTDPAAPVKLGELVLPAGRAYDVTLTADGRHVVVGANPSVRAPSPAAALPGVALWKDACTGATAPVGALPHGPATVLVDVQDPRAPLVVDSFPAPALGPHSVTAADVDGRQLVAVSINNLVHAASHFQFFEVVGGSLELLGAHQAPPRAEANGAPVLNGHVDATIAKHPVTGQLLAYLADWDAGMIVLDISDPLVPRELSRFNPYTGGGHWVTGVETGNLHEAIPIEGLWDGRHYVLAGQEILGHPAANPTGWVWILDDTDPSDVQLVGRWTLPFDVEWEMPLQFSTHYVSLVGRTMFVALYHGGVWAVDLSTEAALRDPPTVGAFVPANAPPVPAASTGADVVGMPTVMDAVPLPGGDIVVFDGQSGLYVVRYDASRPMPAPPSWPGQEVSG